MSNEDEVSFDDFSAVVRDVLSERNFSFAVENILHTIPNCACKDQFVGEVRSWNSVEECGKFATRKNVCKLRKDDFDFKKSSIFILESPNTKEFYKDGDTWKSKGPARYCTGCNMRKFWDNVCERHLDGRMLFIVNAVQYQCSLASSSFKVDDVKSKEKVKDEIVCRCIVEVPRFLRNLRQRIQDIVNLGVDDLIIVNACSRGGCGRHYGRISRFISENFPWKIYEANHPRSWKLHPDPMKPFRG